MITLLQKVSTIFCLNIFNYKAIENRSLLHKYYFRFRKTISIYIPNIYRSAYDRHIEIARTIEQTLQFAFYSTAHTKKIVCTNVLQTIKQQHTRVFPHICPTYKTDKSCGAWQCFIGVTMGTGHSLLTGRRCPSPKKIKSNRNLESEMANEEGFSWVFESLVGFLKGPVWEAAVLTFIEKKSVGENNFFIVWLLKKKNLLFIYLYLKTAINSHSFEIFFYNL